MKKEEKFKMFLESLKYDDISTERLDIITKAFTIIYESSNGNDYNQLVEYLNKNNLVKLEDFEINEDVVTFYVLITINKQVLNELERNYQFTYNKIVNYLENDSGLDYSTIDIDKLEYAFAIKGTYVIEGYFKGSHYKKTDVSPEEYPEFIIANEEYTNVEFSENEGSSYSPFPENSNDIKLAKNVLNKFVEEKYEEIITAKY